MEIYHMGKFPPNNFPGGVKYLQSNDIFSKISVKHVDIFWPRCLK